MRPISVARRLYDFSIDRWVLSAILLTASSAWFVFLRLVNSNPYLFRSDGSMRLRTHLITWPVFGISVVFTFIKTFADRYNEVGKAKGAFIFQRLLESVNAVTEKKLENYRQYLRSQASTVPGATPFRELTQPRSQISSLLDNISVTLSQIFGISRDNIGLSMLYRLRAGDEWDWLSTLNTAQDLTLDHILEDASTSARQIIDRKTASLFYPDKRVALRDKKYVASPTDEPHQNVGSVLCRDLSFVTSGVTIGAVLCVTTYGKQLCEQNDEDARAKIETIIMPTFEKRLQLELSLLYTKEVLSPRCLTCPEPEVGG